MKMRIFTVENFYIVEKLLKSDKQCKFEKNMQKSGGHRGILGDMGDFVKHHFRLISLFSP